MQKLGKFIRRGRDKQFMNRKELATRLKISSGYLALLETDSKVWISPRIKNDLERVLRISIPSRVAINHNKKVKEYTKKRA